jgi:ribosome-interacting GTPase 1
MKPLDEIFETIYNDCLLIRVYLKDEAGASENVPVVKTYVNVF